MKNQEIIKKLSNLDFNGKGENFVEARFLTPLLECLGYETHKDYEVYRHGDDEIDFKLKYPPVEQGAKKVKHYNPDYVPTIRKKIFWIIEAKSPKSVSYPFDYKYIVQGLQYCIHPEIQAKYLILSNGLNTVIYDPHAAIFFDENMYEPVFEFSNKELIHKWEEIYSFLGVEKIREKIEISLKSYYEKLCLSSLDTKYPTHLEKFISKDKVSITNAIEKNVRELYVSKMNSEYEEEKEQLSKMNLQELKISMEYPLGRGSNNASIYYVNKLLEKEDEIFVYNELVKDYDILSYFQKEHCFVGLCQLFQQSSNDKIKDDIYKFMDENACKPLSVLNNAESLFLRIIRKILVVYTHPTLRSEVQKYLENSPEIIRFVENPSVHNFTYANELDLHDKYFLYLKTLTNEDISNLIVNLEEIEKLIDIKYEKAKEHRLSNEIELGGGFEVYGIGNVIWSLKNIAINYNVFKRGHMC